MGILAYEKSRFLDELTDDAIDVLAGDLPRKSSPMSLAPMFILRGAYRDVDEDDTAFGSDRNAKFLLGSDAVSLDRDLYEADRTWAAALDRHAPLRQPIGHLRQPQGRIRRGPNPRLPRVGRVRRLAESMPPPTGARSSTTGRIRSPRCDRPQQACRP